MKLTRQGVRDLSEPKGRECPWCGRPNTTQAHRAEDGECHRQYGDYVAAKVAGELDYDR